MDGGPVGFERLPSALEVVAFSSDIIINQLIDRAIDEIDPFRNIWELESIRIRLFSMSSMVW